MSLNATLLTAGIILLVVWVRRLVYVWQVYFFYGAQNISRSQFSARDQLLSEYKADMRSDRWLVLLPFLALFCDDFVRALINIAFLTLLEACVLVALSGPVKWVTWLSAWVSGLLMPLLFKGLWLIAGGIVDELYVAAGPVENDYAQLLWLPGITLVLIVTLRLTKNAEYLWFPGVVALSSIPLIVQPFLQAAGISVLCFLLFLDQLYRVGNDGNGVGCGVGTMFYMTILLGGGMWKGLYLFVAG